MRKKAKKITKTFPAKYSTRIPIRVLYKKVGQTPEVKIINDVYTLKKAIVQRKLDIISYEKLFIICNNRKTSFYMLPNIFLPLNRISGDLIVVKIDQKEREFKSLSQEDIISYSQDLINKSPPTKAAISKKRIKITDIYERDFEDGRFDKSINFEKTLINVLINLQLVLTTILKNNGDDKK